MLFEHFAVDLGVHEHAREVIGRVLAAIGDQLAAVLEDPGYELAHDRLDAFGVQLVVACAEQRVHHLGPHRVVFLSDADEAADHAGHHGLSEVLDDVDLVTPVETVEGAERDRTDLVLVLGDALGREATLEERLEPVVARRVHPNEHRALQLDRNDVVRAREPLRRRVGLPVAADLVDVFRSRDRPKALLVLVLGDRLCPVDRALAPEPLELLVRRAVEPVLAVCHTELLERYVGRVRSARRIGHGMHRSLI